jgi:hypothetical protein
VHLDFFSLSHDGGNSRGSEGDLIKSIRAAATKENEKNLRVLAPIYKLTGGTAMTERIITSG